MTDEWIRKQPGDPANLSDYHATAAGFSWEAAKAGLDGLPGGGLNIAHEAIDRHLAHGRGDHVGLRWIAWDERVVDFTYADLKDLTDRFAGALRHLGVQPGERVFVLADRVPELYVAALGTLKARSVFCPLFSAFGPEPIQTRMETGDGVVLVTTAKLLKRKVRTIRDQLPDLRHILLIHEGGRVAGMRPSAPAAIEHTGHGEDGVWDLVQLMAEAEPLDGCEPTDPEELALLHFTSGTTGKPKGAMHVHQAVLAHHVTGRFALDLRPDDVFWCTADPGWVTGTSYGIIAPLTHGVTNVIDEGEFDADRWYRILQEQRISVWYTAPTAVRMLMRRGEELAQGYRLDALRFVASVGEPLNPEAVLWSVEALGMPIHDNWWQSETGGIMVANYAGMDIKPGSMGRPMPGIEAAIVQVDGDTVTVLDEPDVEGQLALRVGWPSMFRGYLHEPARYDKCFVGDWYLSGDLARRDADGWFWFVGRADDVIKSAGHLIGPFEVESALIEHEAVAEAAVIGKPDPLAGQIVKAFCALNPGFEASAALHKDLMRHARKTLGPAVAPREIDLVDDLPKTRSGKIMRRLLKARELGLPEGDTSTLETSR